LLAKLIPCFAGVFSQDRHQKQLSHLEMRIVTTTQRLRLFEAYNRSEPS
jgi:hypothetical protein